MIKFIENNLIGLLISIIILSLTIIGCLILSSNKYEDDIVYLQNKNKKLEHELNNAYDCECGWHEEFYYEHADEVGANE